MDGVQLTERQRKIYDIIASGRIENVPVNVPVNVASLALALQVAEKTIKRDLYFLRDMGLIRRVGPAKGGHWEVIK